MELISFCACSLCICIDDFWRSFESFIGLVGTIPSSMEINGIALEIIFVDSNQG